jgi:outer membrane protein TolC
MNIKVPQWLRRTKNTPATERKKEQRHWFHRVEDVYGKILEKTLKLKLLIFLVFIGLMVSAGFVFITKMKFVMFPREETTQVSLAGEAHPGTKRYETARLVQPLEKIFSDYIGKEIIGFRTQIARSRRGGEVQENRMRMRIELVAKEKRDKSSKQLIKEWKKKIAGVPGFIKLDFQKHRFGHSSGSPIEVIIQENNDEVREKVVALMAKSMEEFSALDNVEIDRPLKRPEYKVDLKRKLIKRLGINPSNIKNTFRTLLEGNVLYEVLHEDEEIKVRLTSIEKAKDDIKKVLNVPVENNSNYLVPLKNIVDIKKIISPNSISRKNYKRFTTIDADLSETTDLTPVEIAEYFEENIIPQIISQHPTAGIIFEGEVKETRESQNYFKIAIFMVLFLIYVVLSLLFDSLVKPLLIMVTIPFGLVGIIFAFWGHGITLVGYFAAIGALGLAGVVVNDSIIMLVKLDKEYDRGKHRELSNKQIANIAKTRLRAVILTTLTTVAGLFPTAYGIAGYDAMLADMMLAMSWGLLFSTFITLLLIPSLYGFIRDVKHKFLPTQKVLKSGKLFTFLFVILFCGTVLVEAKEVEPPQVLPLPEFVTKACTNDITFQEILVNQLAVTYTSFLTLPLKDWIFSLKSQHDTVIGGDSTTSPTNSVSLDKLFPASGTNLSIDYDLSGNPSSSENSSSFSVLISQPLAENAFGKTNRYLKKITGIEETVANHQIVEAYEDYLAVLITLYYNWYFAYENLKTAEASYRESLKQLDNMLKRKKSNIALAVDVNKIRLQVLAKKERVISLADNFDQTHNLIKQAIGEKDQSKFLPEETPSFYKSLTRSFDEEYALFKEKSRTSKILGLLEKKSDLELSKDKNALLPSLNLSFGYSRDGSGYRITDESSFAYTMISLEFPYKATQEKAAYEISKLNRRKTVLSSKNKHIHLYTDLLNLYEEIEKTKNLINNARERTKIAQSILKDEQRNYTLGQATLNDLIASINKLEDNRFNKIAYSVQLKLLVTEWFRLTDRLVTPKEITKYKPGYV